MDQARWAADPSGRHQWRYWDGDRWTHDVADGDRTATDPHPVPESTLFTPAGGGDADATADLPRIAATLATTPSGGREADASVGPGRRRRARHLLLVLVTLGAWAVVAPAAHWVRGRAYAMAAAWVAAWLCLVTIGVAFLPGQDADGTPSGGRKAEAFPFLSAGGPDTPATSDGPVATATTSPTGSPSASASVSATATGTSRPPTTAAPTQTASRATAPVKVKATAQATRRPTTRPVTPRPTTSRPRPTKARPTPTPSETGAELDPRYRNCKAVIAHGYGPYVKGVDPEYRWYRDPDEDGVACDREPRGREDGAPA